MLDMNPIGWIVVGLLAGAVSGALLGGVLGGWLAVQMGFAQVNGFIAAVVVAILGSLVIRLILNAISDR